MIPVSKAKQIILRHTKKLTSEKKYFLEALGKTLHEDICANQDWPPFARSTMDGFAVRNKDILKATTKKGVVLKVIDQSIAGNPAKKILGSGQAIKIMTGAVIPKGADCVVMKEYVQEKDKSVTILRKGKKGENLRLKGADVKKGELIVSRGSKITPGVIALLANLGKKYVKVARPVNVGILVNGDELLRIEDKPRLGKIRSANEYALFAQIKELGAQPIILGVAKDNLKSLDKKIKSGLKYDILLISGGVSIGEHDLVQDVLRKLSVNIIFWKVAIKPGKPLVFAKKNQCHIFGLPGNTVSSMVSLREFVTPCILKMYGQKDILSKIAEASLGHDIKVEPKRQKIMRGVVSQKKDKLFVRLSSNQVSENVMSIAKANCFFKIEEGVNFLKKGQRIVIEYL
ncbi:MAG: molybdopterin molybdotransferase MoeA [Candidatus Omnitrophica bacterium]|nr:molybdopterin molybdotransferase MoeA [Candidatus Omnitrophota bacterium]